MYATNWHDDEIGNVGDQFLVWEPYTGRKLGMITYTDNGGCGCSENNCWFPKDPNCWCSFVATLEGLKKSFHSTC
jgi:hypothetical protein